MSDGLERTAKDIFAALRTAGQDAVMQEDPPHYFNGQLIGGTLLDGRFDLILAAQYLLNLGYAPPHKPAPQNRTTTETNTDKSS